VVERTLPQRFEHAGPLTWLLAAGAGWALLLWIAALLGMGANLAEAKPATTGTALPQPRPPAPDRIGPLAQYADAAARPLFTQDRRPRSFMATGPEGDAAAQSQSLDFILTGVLISPQVRLAILQPTGGGASQRVRVGNAPEGASGWRLIDLQPRRALFEGVGGQASLDLRTHGDAGMPAATATRPDAAVPPPPIAMPAGSPPALRATAAEEPQDQEARIEAIRKRIEARRAQLRNNQQNQNADRSASGPGSRQ
jgi:general secretion pathway protein N